MEENKQKKEESCPLCKVSGETLEKLKNNKPKNKKINQPNAGPPRAEKSFWKLW